MWPQWIREVSPCNDLGAYYQDSPWLMDAGYGLKAWDMLCYPVAPVWPGLGESLVSESVLGSESSESRG